MNLNISELYDIIRYSPVIDGDTILTSVNNKLYVSLNNNTFIYSNIPFKSDNVYYVNSKKLYDILRLFYKYNLMVKWNKKSITFKGYKIIIRLDLSYYKNSLILPIDIENNFVWFDVDFKEDKLIVDKEGYPKIEINISSYNKLYTLILDIKIGIGFLGGLYMYGGHYFYYDDKQYYIIVKFRFPNCFMYKVL